MTKDISEGLGCGYITEEGRTCMIRRFKCGRENYAMSVSSGSCAWCGFNPNTKPSIQDDPNA